MNETNGFMSHPKDEASWLNVLCYDRESNPLTADQRHNSLSPMLLTARPRHTIEVDVNKGGINENIIVCRYLCTLYMFANKMHIVKTSYIIHGDKTRCTQVIVCVQNTVVFLVY